MMVKLQLLTACAVPAMMLALALPAHAQDIAAGTVSDEPVAEVPQEEIGADIVVTAQGRSQLLADVPIAVSAVNSESLALSGANDIRQLNQLAPSLLVSSTGSEANGSARIRGIGTVGDNPGLESSVVTFIDGVYRSRSGIGLNELGEIDRIEVLRGPQGTLGGRNSSAGLISIVSKQPEFTLGGNVEATYGNYDFWRFAAGLTGPIISDVLAARIDGVYVKRDGFYNDEANDTRINDRDRYFVRGQLLFQPSADINVRLIGDYSKRDENCCAATYVDSSVNPFIGNLNESGAPFATNLGNGNNMVDVLTALGQDPAAFNQGYSRDVSVTPGRSYASGSEDWGVSGQIDWTLGDVTLTSITAYRNYYNTQASDTDYSTVDILYNGGGDSNSRLFKTFTQELRLQGSLFDDRLDWLIGGFYLDEKIRVNSDLRFGNDYGRFATCRIVSGGGLSGLYDPTSPGCVFPGVGPATLAAAGSPDIAAGFATLDTLNDRGSIVDTYRQNTRSFAAFTHNIIHITDSVDLTLGLRYTDERKRFSANFTNDNTVCTTLQSTVSDEAFSPTSTATQRALAQALLGLGCQGNATAELNGVSINDERNESEFTGTGILSWKATEDLLLYGSYSRGYKAGGFNLDRSALKLPVFSFASQGGAQALVSNLQFDPETVNAFEIGAKYATGPFTVSVAAFRQEFENFQLNTFDGTVFIVQNVNGCTDDLNGGDRDQSKFPGAPNYDAAAATTGACDTDNLGYGVLSQGVELEAQLVPIRDLRIAMGLTYADTKFRDNLVGNASGAPLNQALRKLPGDNLSNAPEIVVTSSVGWTPDLGNSGLSGLFYVDGRLADDYNTGSDLFPQKEQDSFFILNARVGIRGPSEAWSLEFWGQNVLNKDYAQVAFNSPFQEGGNTAAFQDPQYPGGRQLFSQFLAEPRTYGVTLRGKF
ncbi:outer membrane receptor protein involved in Fe transport [Sphingomonas japonica]|uniref:Outer membrane receptor protein involved in Fe transport n=2 Tax=Sphingomonas japonica TaxID=511662 RepID=A0ABX0U4M7_9SPHN|nr:outer membrane receptor protein involved in Fe transport [Sphingomonas japonica]